ncbi:MAG: hypothetical protein K2I16_02400 [Muribaculaceae bacterium]|nr:hypothetical protein [Muribaculaceae bacterium]
MLHATACDSSGQSHRDNKHTVSSNVLRRLNTTISKASIYQKTKINHIDSLKNLLKAGNMPSRQWEVLIEIADQYRQMNADSSIFYAEKAIDAVPDDPSGFKRIRSELSLVTALSTAGIFSPAVWRLDSISRLGLPEDARIEFWKASRIMYSYMLAFVQDHTRYADLFREKYINCDDSLLMLLPPNDTFRQFISAERLVNDAKWEKAKNELETLLKTNSEKTNIYAMAAFQLAIVNKNLGNYNGYVENLAISAECDIKGSVKEGIALPTLANWLYEEGDLENAFNYINFALEEANSGNIRMRTVSIATFMPLIDEAYRHNINSSNKKMFVYLLISTSLLLIAIVLSAVLIKNIRISRTKGKQLESTSKMLEAYVGNFIGLCSNYASRLDQFAKLVTRKINAGQGDDLLKLISSGKFSGEDSDEFYRLIDKAILDIFPDIVEKINTLLLPDKKIELKPDELLIPEIRIYAFVRLGIDQSSKIAQILNYSVNTVYAYRNRMRNRAIDRERFDDNVAKLWRGDENPVSFLA